MKQLIFTLTAALVLTAANTANAKWLSRGPSIIWHCPGVFDALPENGCAPVVRSEDSQLSKASEDNFSSVISSCNQSSFRVELIPSAAIPSGTGYSVEPGSMPGYIMVNLTGSSREASKFNLISTLESLSSSMGHSPISLIECDVVFNPALN